MITLNTDKLAELGNYISQTITKNGALNAKLTIKVDKESLSKIDEDLFYKLRDKEDKTEFIPTENKIYLHFPNVEVEIVD